MPPSHGGLSFIWLFTLRTNEFRASPYHHLTYVFPFGHLKASFHVAHLIITSHTFFLFGHLQASLHAAHLIRTFLPSLM